MWLETVGNKKVIIYKKHDQFSSGVQWFLFCYYFEGNKVDFDENF